MSKDILRLNTIEEFTDHFRFPAPGHPLMTLIRLQGMNYDIGTQRTIQVNLYSIVFKQGVKGSAKYGWRQYDFSKGFMSFFAPGQIVSWDDTVDLADSSGWMLLFHADLVRKYPLGAKIGKYKFFSYETNEALHMSEGEREMMEGIFQTMQREAANYIDEHSQDILVSQIDLLLSYAQRFYTRQFRTRFSVESDVVTKFQAILQSHFDVEQEKLITANEVAAELNMSTHYLSEMLRNLTGMSTQQHIHSFLIEKAKTLLSTTQLSVNEIAYQLGFEYPQYFSRLFKRKTGVTPLDFRHLN